MVKLLMNDINGLSGSINMLGKVKGMEQAEKMAAAMTDQSERLAQSWYVIRAALGSAILPAFNSFVSKIADMGASVIWFTEMFPNITRWLGYIAIGFTAAVAAGGLFTIMMGAGKMAMTTWGLAVMLWTGAGALFTSGLTAMRGVMLALNIAMYANPIGLIVAGIAAAVVAVGALIYYWDDLKATMGEWGWVQAIGGIFTNLWGGIKSIFNDTINWIIEKLNLIPGVDISTNFSSNGGMPSIDAIAPIAANPIKGGISQQIANANNSKSTSVGAINIYPQKVDANFANYVEMHA
jgi:hypothetical protein